MFSNILKVVDQHSGSETRTIEQEKELDTQKVSALLGTPMQTCCVSSKHIQEGKEKYDWDILWNTILI